ncbi:MAG: two component transcriptional regulator, LuxR family [Flaviaesturariibacter sp.]|nr:two component transcriptional regulator, LuxR family [Flaviaesturariibacter sp.]
MTANPDTITVFIADDHLIFRDGLKLLISKLAMQGLCCIGEAENGNGLLEQLGHLQPDIILMDIQMPQLDGIETTAYLQKHFPAIKVLALSSHEDLWSVADMIAAGAKGYLLKNTEKDELLTAIKKVHGGGTYFTPAVAAHLETISQIRVSEKKLTRRETELVRLLCRGQANKEIASTMQISIRTVEGHRKNIMVKLNAFHPADIMTYAVKHGIHKM